MTGPEYATDGCPITRPFASTSEVVSSEVNDESVGAREANDAGITNAPSAAGPGRAAADPSGVPVRLSRTQLERLEAELSERDWHILAIVDQLRFVRANLITALVMATDGPSADRATRRTLGRLIAAGLLLPLPRRVGGLRAGSDGLVVHLTNGGDRLIGRRQDRRRRRHDHPSTRFLLHSLDVGDAVRRLATELPDHGRQLINWHAEPASWRRFPGPGMTATLKPDLSIEVGVGDDAWDFFIEIDRGTESTTTALRQLASYDEYRRSGIEQRMHGSFPVVIWTSYPGGRLSVDARAAQIQAAMAADPTLPPRLCTVTTFEQLGAAILGLTEQSAEDVR